MSKWTHRAKAGSYVCKRCDRRVRVYVRALVTCSHCGRAMTLNLEDEDDLKTS